MTVGVKLPATDDEVVTFLQVHAESIKPKTLKIDPLKWRFALRSVFRGENLMILGESGCGKTLLVQTLHKVLDRPFFYFNMGGTQDPRSTLIGNTHFKKDSGTFVSQAIFVKAIQTPNAIIMLDELSRAHPDAHNILMPVLDANQRYLRIDEDASLPEVKVASGVTFIATANVGSEYTATRTLDRALKDRFAILVMPPLGVEDEMDLLKLSFPKLDDFSIRAIASIADDSRKQVKSESPKVNTIVSTRATTSMAALMQDGFTLAEAAELWVYPFYSDAGGVESPQSYMRKVVQRWLVDPKLAEKKVPFANTGDLNGGAKLPW